MDKNIRMSEILEEERPYEKCLKHGTSHLTNVELLAVLMRTGTKGMNALELARTILKTSDEQENLLAIHQLSLAKLLKMKGIGKVKAIQILCLSELARRLAKASAKEGLTFRNPSSIADYYMEDMRHQKQELMKVLMLYKREINWRIYAYKGYGEFFFSFAERAFYRSTRAWSSFYHIDT